jgi:hypothetical protein
MRFGPRRMRREIGNIQTQLVAGGQASWLESRMIAEAAQALREQAGSGARAASLAQRELGETAAAVRRLVTGR